MEDRWDKLDTRDPIRDTIADPEQPWWWRKIVGPMIRNVNDAQPEKYKVHDFGRLKGPSWCRYRRESHCWLPSDLDEQGTAEAGYDVWIPVDRGTCSRHRYDEQKTCPLSEPGPDSGEAFVYPDATISWNQGGQRHRS